MPQIKGVGKKKKKRSEEAVKKRLAKNPTGKKEATTFHKRRKQSADLAERLQRQMQAQVAQHNEHVMLDRAVRYEGAAKLKFLKPVDEQKKKGVLQKIHSLRKHGPSDPAKKKKTDDASDVADEVAKLTARQDSESEEDSEDDALSQPEEAVEKEESVF